MHRLLYGAKKIANRVGGTRTDEWLWKTFHLMQPGWAAHSLTDESLSHPHRQELLNTLARYDPIQSALEVGCASGPNLLLLARRSPHARITGIDINRHAIQIGTEHMAAVGASNVEMRAGRADDLTAFADRSFDVVFTDAALIYVGPERIDRVLAEMVRVARRGLVFVEYGSEDGTIQRNAHWAHDWRARLSRFAAPDHITLHRMNDACWPGTWAEYGYIVDVNLGSPHA